MKRPDYSPAFAAVRNLLIADLEDPDRRALARMFGAMHESQDDPSAALVAALRAIATLEHDEIVRLARWFKTYVNKWGPVPVASSRRVNPKADRTHPEADRF